MEPTLTKLPEMGNRPRPGPVLIAVSLLLIGCYLAFIAIGLVGLLGGEDGIAAVGAISIAGFGCYCTWEQYRAIFKAHPAAAAQVLAGLKTAVVVEAILTVFLIVMTAGTAQPILIYFVCGAVALLLFTIFSAWQMRLWWLQLVASGTTAEQLADKRFTLQDVFVASIALAIVLAASSYALRQWQPRLVEHVPPQHCPFELPAGASDVSFCVAPSGQVAYEFTVDANGAREWAERLDFLSLPPIQGGVFMPTFFYWRQSYWQCIFVRGQRSSFRRITHGWAVEGYVDGKQVKIAYDETTQRAYYFTLVP